MVEGLKASTPGAAKGLQAQSVPVSPRSDAAAIAKPYSALPTPRVSPQVRVFQSCVSQSGYCAIETCMLQQHGEKVCQGVIHACAWTLVRTVKR